MITLPVTLTVQDLADYQTFSFRHFYQEPVGWRRIPYILIWLILCGMLLLIFSTFSPLPGKFDIYSVFYGLSCGFLALLVFIYSRFVKSRRVMKQLSVQSGHYLLRQATFELNNDGINQVSALYHSFLPGNRSLIMPKAPPGFIFTTVNMTVLLFRCGIFSQRHRRKIFCTCCHRK